MGTATIYELCSHEVWASVLDEVEQMLERATTFGRGCATTFGRGSATTRLRPQNWKSGDRLWVLQQRVSQEVVISGGEPVLPHPERYHEAGRLPVVGQSTVKLLRHTSRDHSAPEPVQLGHPPNGRPPVLCPGENDITLIGGAGYIECARIDGQSTMLDSVCRQLVNDHRECGGSSFADAHPWNRDPDTAGERPLIVVGCEQHG